MHVYLITDHLILHQSFTFFCFRALYSRYISDLVISLPNNVAQLNCLFLLSSPALLDIYCLKATAKNKIR